MFFVLSQLEYTLWLETFKLVLEMNLRKIPVTLVNPFDYDSYIKSIEPKTSPRLEYTRKLSESLTR